MDLTPIPYLIGLVWGQNISVFLMFLNFLSVSNVLPELRTSGLDDAGLDDLEVCAKPGKHLGEKKWNPE